MFRANGDVFKQISVNKIKNQCKSAGGSDNALDYDEFLAFIAGAALARCDRDRPACMAFRAGAASAL